MVTNGTTTYYLYEELEGLIRQQLKDRLLNAEYKFIGDIEKVRFSKKRIGEELSRQGYKRKRFQIDGVRKQYYYKE